MSRLIIGSRRLDCRRRLGVHGVRIEEIPVLSRFRVVENMSLIGACPKAFVEIEGVAYLAKRPRLTGHTGSRECVTEHLIAQVGKTLPLKVADSRLVRLKGLGPPPHVHFMSRWFLSRDTEHLRHCVELFSRSFEIDRDTMRNEVGATDRDERAFYTIDLVDDVLGDAAGSSAVHRHLRGGLARMLAFDALVGSADRHPNNWGIVENVWASKALRFAPVFDTARGLFLRRSDQELRDHIGDEVYLAKYARRARPLIGHEGANNCNHFELIQFMLNKHSDRYRSAVQLVVGGFDLHTIRRTLKKKFARLISRARLDMIISLLTYRHAVLCGILRGERPSW